MDYYNNYPLTYKQAFRLMYDLVIRVTMSWHKFIDEYQLEEPVDELRLWSIYLANVPEERAEREHQEERKRLDDIELKQV